METKQNDFAAQVAADAAAQAHAEGGVEDAAEHKALDLAPHLIPIVHYHDVQYNGDYRPYNSVNDFKSFHIHVVFELFSFYLYRLCHRKL